MTRKTKLHLVGQDPADIFDDLDKLKADSMTPAQQASPSKGWRRYSTEVPREWELRLQRATRISSYRLALELLYQKWRAEQGKYGRKGEPVIVSSEVVKIAGLSTRSMDNALSDGEGPEGRACGAPKGGLRVHLCSMFRSKRHGGGSRFTP